MGKRFENFNRELIPSKLSDNEAEDIVKEIDDNRLTLDKNHSEYFNILIDEETNRRIKVLRRVFILNNNKRVKIKDYLEQVLNNLDED